MKITYHLNNMPDACDLLRCIYVGGYYSVHAVSGCYRVDYRWCCSHTRDEYDSRTEAAIAMVQAYRRRLVDIDAGHSTARIQEVSE